MENAFEKPYWRNKMSYYIKMTLEGCCKDEIKNALQKPSE